MSKQNIATPLILIFSVSFILYLNTLGHEYALDDTMMITENSFTHKGVSGLAEIFTNDAFVGFFGEEKTLLEGGRYRPLSHASFAIEYELFGLNPHASHFFNTLFYALLCCLIFLTLKKLFPTAAGKTKWYITLPFVITLLYAIHPVHTEAVANIKGRDELMSMFFSIATLYFYLDFIGNKDYKYGVLTGFCFLLALLSKENSLTFIAVIPITVHYFTTHSLKVNLKSIYILLIPVLVFFLLRYNALGFFVGAGKESGELLNNPFLHASTSERYATVFYTLAVYLKLLFFPYPLTHDYYPEHIPIVGWDHPVVLLSFVVYVVLLFVALKSLNKRHPAGYGIWFYLLTLSIVSNLFVSIGTFMNERFLFMPSLGFAMIAGYYLQKAITGELIKGKVISTIAMVLFVLIIISFSYKTVDRNTVWKDDYTLFTTDVKTSKNSVKVNVSAGGALIERAVAPRTRENQREKKLLKAISYIKRGLDMHSEYTAGWLLLGNAYFHLGEYERAFEAYLSCLETSPRYEYALSNLSMLGKKALNENELEIARKSYEKLIYLKTQHAEYYFQLALVFEKKEDYDRAVKNLEKVVSIDSTYYRALRKHGEIEGKIFGNIEKSVKYLEEALKISPNDVTTLENLGVAYGIAGEFEESLNYFYRALEQKPGDVQLLRNISLSYRRMGMPDKAQEYFEKSLEAE